jgi:hypothetical protein
MAFQQKTKGNRLENTPDEQQILKLPRIITIQNYRK